MLPLLEQFALSLVDETHFVAPASNESHSRAFGGQIIAQALLAAGRTVPNDRRCHSLHGYFLRPAATHGDLHLTTDIVRDGRSFSVRHVEITQNDKHTFSLMASFHREEAGAEHQATLPSVVEPEDLPVFAERFAGRESYEQVGRWFDRVQAFDVRFAGPTPLDEHPEHRSNHSHYWVRFTESLPGDVLLHQATVAYMSDMFILDPIFLQHGVSWTSSKVLGASLDHAMWFHRDFDATQWLLFDQESSISAHNRGLSSARIWSRDGQLVATVLQEALLRPPHGSDNAQ